MKMHPSTSTAAGATRLPSDLRVRSVSGRGVASALAAVTSAGGALLFGRNLGDVRIELFLDQRLDPSGECRERIAVTAVRCVRSGVLEEEPAFDLHLLGGRSVVPPALPELEEAFDGCADRDDEA